MKRIFIILLLFVFSINTPWISAEQELVVHLETENQLIPITLMPFAEHESGFSKEYLSDLEKIFHFDFNNNGMTVVSIDDGNSSVYRIEVIVKEHRLSAKIFYLGDDETSFEDLHLTGYLGEDRRILHNLADTIHEKLFGVRGVATTKLLFTIRSKANGKDYSEVWESDYDGGNVRQVTSNSGYSVTPAYIPPIPGLSAGSFVYVSYQTGQPKIYVSSLENSKGRMLISLSGNQLMPTVSRQRDRIAFISDTTGNPDLFIQDFDPEKGVVGKPRHLYTALYATQGTPTFSPDGTRISFVSNKSGTPRIYVIKIPASGTPLKDIQPVLISKFTRGNTAPSWSPDGTKIAYCAKIGEVRQIMIYDFLTGIERQLTSGPGNKENPVWAPNSLHLVYNTTDAQSCELYLINLKQAHAIKLNLGKGEKHFPSWEPRAFL